MLTYSSRFHEVQDAINQQLADIAESNRQAAAAEQAGQSSACRSWWRRVLPKALHH